MDVEFVMPMLGVDIEEGVVRRWLKVPGDRVAPGELICVIGTTKLDMEVECPHAGTVKTLLVGEEEVAAVGAPLAIIAS